MDIEKKSNLKIRTAGKDNRLNREAWLKQALASLPAGSRILDAGAGTQQYKVFCTHLNYVSQDFGGYNGVGDEAGLQTGEFNYGKLDIVSDITAIPQPDASFDAIMCIEVLEHLVDPLLALKEFSRLLKKNGVLIISAPFCSLTHFAPYHYSSGFNKYWYEAHLPTYGLNITHLAPNGNYFSYIAQEVNRIPNMSKTYADKNVNLIDRIAIYLLKRTLTRLHKRDSRSSEVLCYGYHLVAHKA